MAFKRNLQSRILTWLLAFVLILKVQTQVIFPTVDVSKLFTVGSNQASLTTTNIKTFVVTFPSGFIISTLPTRKPFFVLSSMSDFKFQNKEGFYLWSRITTWTTTSFTFQIQNVIKYTTIPPIVIMDHFGFRLNSIVKYRYLIISDRFPSIYFSRDLYFPPTPLIVLNNGAMDNQTFSLLALSTPVPSAPLYLNETNSVFIHSLIDCTVNDTTPTPNSNLGLKLSFTVKTPEIFQIKITTKYRAQVYKMGLMLFIYNKNEFQNLRVNFYYQDYTLINLAGTTGSKLFDFYTMPVMTMPPLSFTNNSFLFGFNGLELTNEREFGFEFFVKNITVTGVNFMVQLDNLFTGAPIPRLDMFLFFITDLQCPNNYFFVNATINQCYMFCPDGTYPSNQMATAILSICSNCIPTCKLCAFAASNCTQCDPLLKRELVSFSCPPITHYFDDGTPLAKICDVTCKQCSTISTNCTQCYLNAYKTATNSCVLCTTYHAQCLTCNSSQCLTCNDGFIVSIDGKCVACTDYHLQCATCNSSQCQSCNVGYFLNGLGCTACTVYHAQCKECSNTSCTLCNSPYIPTSQGSCVQCVDYGTGCTSCSGSRCLECSTGSYPNGIGCESCTKFHSQCTACTNTSCTSCIAPFIPSSQGSCVQCSDYHPQCLTCNNSQCLSCSQGLYQSGITCATCQNLHAQCTQCTATQCSACGSGFYVNSLKSCVTCSDYHSQCLTCTGVGCTSCNPGYLLSGGTCLSCAALLNSPRCYECDINQCLSCSPGYFLQSNQCISCSMTYSPRCQTCTSSKCLSCEQPSTLNPATSKCVGEIVCGDGLWVSSREECDDGNLEAMDGCDPNCKIQEDFVCLSADVLPSGTSFCKYTKPVTVQFSSLQKSQTSNTINLFYTLKPSFFKQWNQQTIMKLITPIQILDPATGLTQTLPSNNFTFEFLKSLKENQIHLTVNYEEPLEGKFLKYNVQPNQTPISSIQYMTSANNLLVKLAKAGVPLLPYNEDVYALQKTLSSVCMGIGLLAMLLMFLAVLIPAGKLIIVQGLAVVQLTYFSILQFPTLPPTYLSFRSLIISNGFNSPSLFPSQSNDHSTFTLLGLYPSLLSNYNISFILLVLLPFLCGLIGWIVCNFCKKQGKTTTEEEQYKLIQDENNVKANVSATEEENKNQLRNNLWNVVWKRVLLEYAFCGLMLTAYMAWVSVFHSFSQGNVLTLVPAVVIILIWIIYIVLFLRTQISQVDLQKSSNNSPQTKPQTKILTGFAEFRWVKQQISKHQNAQNSKSQKLYLIFIFERIIVSALLAIVSASFTKVSVIILVLYILLLVGLLIWRNRMQKESAQQSEHTVKTLFSHLYQNYTLRQCFNFTMTIVIQLILSVQGMMLSSENSQSGQSPLLTKVFPSVILSLLALVLVVTVCLWVWELTHERLGLKAKGMTRLLCKSKYEDEQNEKMSQNKMIKDSFRTINGAKPNSKAIAQEQNYITNKMIHMIENSPYFSIKNSPFIGSLQKQSKTKAINLLKLQRQKQNPAPAFSLVQHTFDPQTTMRAFDQI